MNLAAVMSLDAAAFTGPLQGADRQMNLSIGSLTGMIGKLAGLAAGYLSVRGAISGLSSAMTLGADLDHQSKQTGIAVNELVILRQAFDDTGVGADSLAESMAYMQRNMEQVNKSGESTNKGFARLGINLESFKQMSASEQLQLVEQRLGGLSTQSEKTAAVMDIFGRSGSKMLRLFESKGAIDAARESLGSMPDMMARNAAAFENLDTVMGRARGKVTGLWAGLLESAMPALEGIMNYVDKIDFAKWGQALGNALRTGMAIFESGQAGKVIRLSLGIAFGSAVNMLIGPLMQGSTWKGIGQIMLAGFMGIGAGLIRLFAEPLILLQAGMDKVIDMLFEGLGKIPGIGKALGLDDYQSVSFAEHLATRRSEGTFLTRSGEASAAMASGMLSSGMANVSNGMANAQDIMGTAALRTELSGIVTAARESFAEVAPAVSEALAETAAPAAAAGANAAAAASGGKFDSSADRLAKIGLFVGGGGVAGAQTRLAERTARATEKLNEQMKALLARDAGDLVAVWG